MPTPKTTTNKRSAEKNKKAIRLTENDKLVLKRARILPHGNTSTTKKVEEHESNAAARK